MSRNIARIHGRATEQGYSVVYVSEFAGRRDTQEGRCIQLAEVWPDPLMRSRPVRRSLDVVQLTRAGVQALHELLGRWLDGEEIPEID